MKRTPRELVDVLVVGGGPAGASAALTVAAAGLRTMLVERNPGKQGAASCAGWIGPAGVELAKSLGLTVTNVGAEEFSGVQLFSWDFKHRVAVSDESLCGWIVDRGRFDESLRVAASTNGAVVVRGVYPEQVELGEAAVRVRVARRSQPIEAHLLVVADGADSRTAQLAQLPAAHGAGSEGSCAFAEFDSPGAKPGIDMVLGGSRDFRIATLIRQKGRVRVSLVSRDASRPASEQLRALVSSAVSQKAIAAPEIFRVVEGSALSGAALDLDSHVGKRCLLIGDAGGFVASFSQEGIFPAMKSGVLAAEAAARAFKAPVFQDELQEYSTAWRTALADYLRMPNTDLSLLIPLVFNNPQMSRRIARAFLLGEGF